MVTSAKSFICLVLTNSRSLVANFLVTSSPSRITLLTSLSNHAGLPTTFGVVITSFATGAASLPKNLNAPV